MPTDAQALVSLTPILQYGFAGFSLLLLGMIFWLIGRLMNLLQDTNQVIGGNTQALLAVRNAEAKTRRAVAAIRRELASRPCAFDARAWKRADPQPDLDHESTTAGATG